MKVRGWVYRSKIDWKNLQGPYTSRVPINHMRVLLEYEAMADPDTQRRFERWARGECRDIRFEVDLAIARKMGRDFSLSRYGSPNINRFFKTASKLANNGSYQEAIHIYKGITESIGVHMDFIPDKSGDCSYDMRMALLEMAKCIRSADMDNAKRQEEIKYLAEWGMRVIDWYATNYADALHDICQTEKDLDIWESVLENPPKVEDDYSGPSHYGTEDLYKKLKERRKSFKKSLLN